MAVDQSSRRGTFLQGQESRVSIVATIVAREVGAIMRQTIMIKEGVMIARAIIKLKSNRNQSNQAKFKP
jgi:hypothetical protein